MRSRQPRHATPLILVIHNEDDGRHIGLRLHDGHSRNTAVPDLAVPYAAPMAPKTMAEVAPMTPKSRLVRRRPCLKVCIGVSGGQGGPAR